MLLYYGIKGLCYAQSSVISYVLTAAQQADRDMTIP
jgi:hypothetical protein